VKGWIRSFFQEFEREADNDGQSAKTSRLQNDLGKVQFMFYSLVFMDYTLPFKSLGSPRQFRVFHENSHFYLSNELQNV